MSFSRRSALIAAVAVAVFGASMDTASACGGRGRSGGGYARSYSSHSFGYSAPVQHYSTPGYGSPAYGTPTYPYSQPVASQQINIVAQQPVQSAPTFQQAPQPIRPVSQQQTVAPVQQPRPPQQQPASAAPNAALDALRALGGFAPPIQAPATPPATSAPTRQTPVHVGTWTASLGNGSTVNLTLEEDGHFRWVATNQSGQSSSFEGTYSVNGGSLSLQRSNDSQQLGGSMTLNGNNAFSFQVAGNNAASLNFQRS